MRTDRVTSSRRELTVAVLLCLLGAALVLVAAGSPWSRVEVAATGLAGARTVEVTGNEVVPGVRALGLVGLAGVVALAATRRTGRTLVGLVLVVVGVGAVAAVVGADTAPALLAKAAEGGGQAGDGRSGTGWRAVAVAGGVLLALAGLVVAARGR
ncbi:MAG: Trp biosynthesis associated, transrane protein Oprn/Chp, partial [Frankiales bacterium]|nr:Trp biosynthesis associated, transrane protein Oprn/Chp [Frankiales bacterium]